MIINAFGRAWIEDKVYLNLPESNVSHILISITGEEKYKVNLTYVQQSNFNKDILTMYFEDITKQDQCVGCVLFNEKHCKNILDFTNKYIDDISSIIVHCDAGISRSIAVASALSKILNRADDIIFNKGMPNLHVYGMLLKYYSSYIDDYDKLSKFYYKEHPITINF